MAAPVPFWQDETGQDFVEYTLLIAFVAMAAAAMFLGTHESVAVVWNVTNDELDHAVGSAS
jgi:Flp pilus assembly pilin Flp